MTETVDNRGVASDEDADPARMVSGMKLLPGENPLDKEQLRMTLMAEFAPKTAYQRRLAEQLVEYEWEIGRHRRFRDLGIRDLERRRTLLRKEFGELQSACRTVVEDAEIIEADG